MLSRVCDKHPQVISSILQITSKSLSNIGKVSIFLFSGLPLSHWKVESEDLNLLQDWLIYSDLSSVQCKLSRTILERLNWSYEINEFGNETGQLFLARSVHYYMMAVLTSAYVTHLVGYPAEKLFQEDSKGSSLFRGESDTDKMAQWLWRTALQLQVNLNHSRQQELIHIEESIPDILNNDKYSGIVHAKEQGFGIGYYFIIVSKYGHSIDDFCVEGLDLLNILIEKGYFIPALHILSIVLPLVYEPLQQPRLINNARFKKVITSLMKYDESKRQYFTSKFPGTLTQLFSGMIQTHIEANPVLKKEIITFWFRALLQLEWMQSRDCQYILNNLCKASELDAAIVELLYSDMKQVHSDHLEKSQASGVLSWLAGNSGLPSLLDGQLCAEFPWLLYIVIKTEMTWERETQLWSALHEELVKTNMEYVDANVYKKVLTQLKIQKAPALQKLSIYRWAEQIVQSEHSDKALPLLCQNFFILYLGRTPQVSGLSHQGSIGDKFFSHGRNLTLIKSMKQKLSNAADYYQKQATSLNSDEESNTEKKQMNHTLAKFYRGLSYWLDEPRLHNESLHLPSLPSQYEIEHLSAIVQYQLKPWLHVLDKREILSQLKEHGKFWRRYFSFGVSQERSRLPERHGDPLTRVFNRLASYDMPLPAPSIEPINRPVAELPPALICDKQNLVHSLRADFESLAGYSKLYDERTQKHVALDCSYLELLPELYKPRHTEVTVSIPCRSMINPLHKCKAPAAATVSYSGTARDEIISRKLTENRAEYKQLLIEALLPPSQHLCSAAVHVETTITALIKLYKTTANTSNKADLQDVGCTLFYNVAAYVSEITKYYPPTRQFFSSCLDTLGQEFIRNNRSQAQPLLQAILQNPILVNMMASNFSPNASPQLFITMYEDLVPVPTNQGSDVALTLLTKFDISAWAREDVVGQSQRKMLMEIIFRALGQCGQRPAKDVRMICEVYRNHLTEVYEYKYPELYHETLMLQLSAASSGHILVDVWEDFIQCLFSDHNKHNLDSKLKDVTQVDINSSGAQGNVRIHQLSFQQILDSLNAVSCHCHNLRYTTMFLQGLYPRWRAYIEPFSILVNALCRSYIYWNLKWVKNGQTSYSIMLGDLWQRLRDVMKPWLEMYQVNEELTAAWLQADMEPASFILQAWVNNILLLHAEVKQIQGCDTREILSPLNLLWNWYVESYCKVDVPAHVLTLVHKYLIDVPWVEFVPNLMDLDHMILVISRNDTRCLEFLVQIVSKMNWTSYYNDIVAPKLSNDTEVASCFLVKLFHIFVTLPNFAEEMELKLNEVLSTMENKQWDAIDAANFQNTIQSYVEHCKAKCVLLQRSHPSVMPLRFLRKGSMFTSQVHRNVVHPETPVKRVSLVMNMICLLSKCSSVMEEESHNISEENVKTAFSNLVTDIEAVVATEENCEMKQLSLSLCSEVVNVLNICYRDKAPLFMNALLEWIDHSPKSILLESFISASCRTLVDIPFMLQLTERCIDAHFHMEAGDESKNWVTVLSNLQVPELSKEEFIDCSVSDGAYLTLQAHMMQQLPLSQSIQEEMHYCKKIVQWTQQAKPSTSNDYKLLMWWWQLLTLSERQVHYNGSLTDLTDILHQFSSIAWTLGEDKDSTGFFGAIGFGRRSQLSIQFRVVCKCMATFIASQLSRNNAPRTNASDPVLFKNATVDNSVSLSPRRDKDELRHYKMVNQCVAHIEGLITNNKAYVDFKSDLQHALEFIYSKENTLLQGSLLLKYFITRFYSNYGCFCDVKM